MTNLASGELTWQHDPSQFLAYLQYAIKLVQIKQVSCYFELVFFDRLHRKKYKCMALKVHEALFEVHIFMSYILCTNASLAMDNNMCPPCYFLMSDQKC